MPFALMPFAILCHFLVCAHFQFNTLQLIYVNLLMPTFSGMQLGRKTVTWFVICSELLRSSRTTVSGSHI